jgi:tripartite-type tricarboxylate transporter receptor subunit TctC
LSCPERLTHTELSYLPAKTPRDIVDKLQRETAKAIQSPAVHH